MLSQSVKKYINNSQSDSEHIDNFKDMNTNVLNIPTILCTKNNNITLKLTDICIFKIDSNGKLQPCNSGNHLESCVDFQCSTYFKCPKYYCIPWSYVCDGKWDCPLGEDEVTGDICYKDGFCEGLYKCRNSKLCISPGNICDNYFECPYNDDEMFCDLFYVYCPSKCTCLLYGITCFYFDFKVF